MNPAYVFDTYIMSLVERGHPALKTRIAGEDPASLSTTVISFREQLDGWQDYIRKAKTDQAIERGHDGLIGALDLYGRMRVLRYDVPSIAKFKLLLGLRINIGKNDLRIAAIALVHGATLVTRNLRDFGRVPGLIVEDWTV